MRELALVNEAMVMKILSDLRNTETQTDGPEVKTCHTHGH